MASMLKHIAYKVKKVKNEENEERKKRGRMNCNEQCNEDKNLSVKERKRRKWKKKIYDEEKNLVVEACSMRGREGREE